MTFPHDTKGVAQGTTGVTKTTTMVSKTATSTRAILPLDIPFTQEQELNQELYIEGAGNARRIRSKSAKDDKSTLPGQPGIELDSQRFFSYLEHELFTPDLNKMSPCLWLVATQSSSHISPLHEQIVRGRQIIITENPELHLVWVSNRVYIKPVPPYLLSYAFWQFYLATGEEAWSPFTNDEGQFVRKAALGFMRSYYYLVRHESDFRIAKATHLIPAEVEWPEFVSFFSGFANVLDTDVTPRYHFGNLRLTRLNFWAKVVLHRWSFHEVYWQYEAYFARFYAPLLFIFGVFSVVLSAMQVGLAVNHPWDAFQAVSRWFPVLTLLCIALVAAMFCSLAVLFFMREVLFALRDLIRKSGSRATAV
ncbi:MAG: hypothetical protein M1824_005895 [Vezdaea acicularis]|nr:MAG: hypothetical protein M1824_005895 [Vezdaea acicularis]